MSFPKYEAYKDSGIEQLDIIPSHWIISRLGFESWVRARLGWKGLKAEEYVDEGYIFLSTPNIKSQYIDFENVNYINQIRFDESPEIKLKEGDVLLAKDGSTLGIANFVRSLPCPATVNSSIAVITPNDRLDGLYLKYLLESNFLQSVIQMVKGGMGVPHLFQSDLNKFYIPLPAIEEQTQIARFLDHETARIDALIAEQQRLIELLKEKRQAVISHAVTKGLDPTAPMKDSGVEWLGEVPAHWVVTKLKFITERIVDCPHETPVYDSTGDYFVIRTADVDQGVLKPEQMYHLDYEQYLNRTRREPLLQNDIVYGREGERWGHAALVTSSNLFVLGQRMMQFRAENRICPLFLMFQLNSVSTYRQGEVDTVGSTSPHVNISTIRNYQLMMPPLKEQKLISKYLQKISKALDSLIEESMNTAELLQERRSALISAAVTGKIDVRGWQAATSASPAPTLEPAHS